MKQPYALRHVLRVNASETEPQLWGAVLRVRRNDTHAAGKGDCRQFLRRLGALENQLRTERGFCKAYFCNGAEVFIEQRYQTWPIRKYTVST